jgi:hypothetical protein
MTSRFRSLRAGFRIRFWLALAFAAGLASPAAAVRVQAERQALQARVEAVRDALSARTSLPDHAFDVVAQWYNWYNWPNWNNWGNWPNWVNWFNR